MLSGSEPLTTGKFRARVYAAEPEYIRDTEIVEYRHSVMGATNSWTPRLELMVIYYQFSYSTCWTTPTATSSTRMTFPCIRLIASNDLIAAL